MSVFRVSLIVSIVLLLLLLPAVLLAQDTPTPEVTATEPAPTETPAPEEPPPVEPPPEETPVTSPSELLGQLFALLKDGTYIVWASAGVVIFVGLLKAVSNALGRPIQGTGAMLLTLAVQVLVWIGYAIANYFGAGEAFQKGYLIVVDIARSLLPLVGAIFGAHVLYHAAAKRQIPVLGTRAPEHVYKVNAAA